MEQFSNILDNAIKAPLWFWFAIMIASGIPMLNVPVLVSIGIDSRLKIFDVPLALIAILSTALFTAGIFARSVGTIKSLARPFGERLAIWWSLSRLEPEARAILWLFEEDGLVHLYYPPEDKNLASLRDQGFLLPQNVGEQRDWGSYCATQKLERTLRKHREMARRLLRTEEKLSRQVRSLSKKADRAASRLV